MFKCKICNSEADTLMFVPVLNTKTDYPKYYFQIKQCCYKCGRLHKILENTPELMVKLDHATLTNLSKLPF